MHLFFIADEAFEMASVALAISVLLMVVWGAGHARRQCYWSVSCQRGAGGATSGAPLRPRRPPVRTTAARRRDSPSPSPRHWHTSAIHGVPGAGARGGIPLRMWVSN